MTLSPGEALWGPASPGATEPSWREISKEFRSLLSEGTLDPSELHAKYRKQLKKVRRLSWVGFVQLKERLVYCSTREEVTLNTE